MDSSDTRKRLVKSWTEQDAYTAWRHYYCYLSRPGAVKGIKRMTHKRERQDKRRELEQELEDYLLK